MHPSKYKYITTMFLSLLHPRETPFSTTSNPSHAIKARRRLQPSLPPRLPPSLGLQPHRLRSRSSAIRHPSSRGSHAVRTPQRQPGCRSKRRKRDDSEDGAAPVRKRKQKDGVELGVPKEDDDEEEMPVGKVEREGGGVA